MDKQVAVDRILGTENLTDGLEDDDADWLLHWGISHIEALIADITDDDQAGAVINNLMTVMRTLNQIAADRMVKSSDLLAEDIKTFFGTYISLFGGTRVLKRGEAKRISTKISTLSAGETLQHLIATAEQVD